MRNLLISDLTRFAKKKTVWLYFALLVIFGIVYAPLSVMKTIDTPYNFMKALDYAVYIFQAVFIFVIFQAVYADDFSYMTIVTIIGEGKSRTKLVISKLIYAAIVTVAMYALYGLFIFIYIKTSGKALLPIEENYIYFSIIRYTITTIGAEAIASIIIYLSGNIPFSILGIVVLAFGGSTIFDVLTTFSFLGRLHIERIWFFNLCDSGLTDIVHGNTARGLGVMFGALAVTITISLAVIIPIFNRKELDL